MKKNQSERIVFGECFTVSLEDFSEYAQFEGESYIVPKVIDVVKAGNMLDNPTYALSRYFWGEKDEWQTLNRNLDRWAEFPSDLNDKVLAGFETNGGWKGIVDASCSNVESSDLWSRLLSLATGNPLEKMGCWEFYNLVFGGSFEPISNKRWCLFSIPETQSFLKETNFLDLFSFSSWNTRNQFWAKCDPLGL